MILESLLAEKCQIVHVDTIHKVPTGSELADILTKAMPKEGGESFRRTAGMLLGYSFT